MTYRLSSVAWVALFAGFVITTLVGCGTSSPPEACAQVAAIIDDHGDITTPDEAQDFAYDLAIVASQPSPIQPELDVLVDAITDDTFDGDYLEAAQSIDEECGP